MVKGKILQLVERSPLTVRQSLKELKVSPSTYYRWQRRYVEKGSDGLKDLPPIAKRVWNRVEDKERDLIVAHALRHPSLSPREVAIRLIDGERRKNITPGRQLPTSYGILMPATSSWQDGVITT